jgi:SAM-dependent methyltransferase
VYKQDLSKDRFKELWPCGYLENFGLGYHDTAFTDVCEICRPFFDRNGIALELGPGRGRWTVMLAAEFRQVVALDVISMPASLARLTNLVYVELADRDYACTGVQDNSVDFAFSFGLFCHLSNEACAAYLASVYRVLKPGGALVASFANWERHPLLNGKAFEFSNRPNSMDWFFCNWSLADRMAAEAGFIKRKDALPLFRDTLLVAFKP